MFANHQPLIARFAGTPDGLAKVLQLAILTAHAPFQRAVSDMEAVERGERDSLSVLFGWKFRAVSEVREHRETIFRHCREIIYHSNCTRELDDDLLAYVATLHGLGFAKAGFAVQMAFGRSGCLDTHILKRFGVPTGTARARYSEAKRPTTWRAKVKRYNDAVDTLGGSAGLWDTWCEHMAQIHPKAFESAHKVSELHCIALGIPLT